MSTEKFEKISNILDGSSVRLRESYFFKNYNSLLSEINEYCSDIDVTFVQKIWHWVNEKPTYILCKCGNKTSFNRNWIDGYRKACSSKCTQSDNDTKEKRKLTTLEKYGVDNIAKLQNTKDKTEQTNLEKYGHKSSFQNDDVRNKWKDNMQMKYGVDHYFKTIEFKNKSKKYYLEKWGVDHQSKVDEIQDRIQTTCFDRYGVNTYLNTDHSRSSIRKYNKSSHEIEISEWLKKLGVKLEESKYGIISPFTLDIYIESHKLAIEFNGLYWHSEFIKDKNYHLNKTNMCNSIGIQLIHIWEDDWINRKDICKSIILNKLGIIERKIFARNCEIRKVYSNEEVSIFLNKNHIQGYTKFSDSYALYHNNEIVSLMVFGWRNINAKREYELIRFCNKINTNIVGGASKLFKNFIKNNKDMSNITSFADISVFNGTLYEKLGFKFIHRTPPNYWWSVKGVRKHRFTYNKQKLIKLGHDRTKTEVEIMHSLGHYRVYGCGLDKYIFTN